jgi:hypothetical protein
MALQSSADVPLLITSPNSSSERRISPSWSIAHLKTRLEPITGVPASCQQLSLRIASQDPTPISAQDEEQTLLAAFPLQPYAEIAVSPLSTYLVPCLAAHGLFFSLSTATLLIASIPCLFLAFGPSPSVRCFDAVTQRPVRPDSPILTIVSQITLCVV